MPCQVLTARALVGVKVSTVPPAFQLVDPLIVPVTVPQVALEQVTSAKLVMPVTDSFIASLKVTVIAATVEMLVAASAGTVDETVGCVESEVACTCAESRPLVC